MRRLSRLRVALPIARPFYAPFESFGGPLPFSTSTILNRESLGLQLERTTFANTGPLSHSEFLIQKSSLPENRPLVTRIKIAARDRKWEDALSTFRESSTPDALIYSVLLHAADRCNRAREAFAIYEEMGRNNIPMGGAHFTALIRLAGRAGQLEKAMSFKQDAQRFGIEMNAFICCALIDAHKNAKDAAGALLIWQEAKAAGVSITPPLLSSLMSAVAQTGDIAGTEALLREADGHFRPNRIHLNCMLDACRRACDADAALRALADQKANGVYPDVISFTLLLSTMRATGHSLADASAIFQQMQDSGVEPDKFFLEEHLSLLMGVSIRAIARDAAALRDCDRSALESAVKLIDEFKSSGKQLSQMSEELHRRLSAYLSSGSGSPAESTEWFRVLSEKGPEYFWDRVSGKTQWEYPVGPILGTLQAPSS